MPQSSCGAAVNGVPRRNGWTLAKKAAPPRYHVAGESRVRRSLLLLAATGTVLVLALGSGAAHGRTGLYRIALLRVSYSNASNHLWTRQPFDMAAGEIHDFFDRLSYGRLDVRVSVVDVTLQNTEQYYFDACAPTGEQRNPCPPPLIEDAAQAAASNKLDFAGVDGIVLVSPACRGDWTNGALQITRPGVNGTLQRSYDFECALPASLPSPGASGVVWNGWAHEIGHQLQLADGVTLGGTWNGHPSGYASGYELMDSCYPCGESVYSLSGPPIMNGVKKVFPGFLDAGRVITVPAQSTGTQGQTVTLTHRSNLEWPATAERKASRSSSTRPAAATTRSLAARTGAPTPTELGQGCGIRGFESARSTRTPTRPSPTSNRVTTRSSGSSLAAASAMPPPIRAHRTAKFRAAPPPSTAVTSPTTAGLTHSGTKASDSKTRRTTSRSVSTRNSRAAVSVRVRRLDPWHRAAQPPRPLCPARVHRTLYVREPRHLD